jgi:hypothetical protein
MAIINSYPTVTPSTTDLLVISDISDSSNPTKTVTIGNVLNLTATGGLTGSGATGQVTFWNSASSITGSNSFFYDASNSYLGLGTATPSNTLHIVGGNFPQIKIEQAEGAGDPAISFVETNVRDQWNIGLDNEPIDSLFKISSGVFGTAGDAITIVPVTSSVDSMILSTNTVVSDTTYDLDPVASDASAVLEARSITKGFLPPRMSSAQRTGISNPAAGLIVFDTTNNGTYVYNGTIWENISGGAYAWAVDTDSQSPLTVTSGTTLEILGGTNVTTSRIGSKISIDATGGITSVTASPAGNLKGLSASPTTGNVVIGLDITNQTDLSASPRSDDFMLVYQTITNTNKKVSISDLMSAAPQGTVTGLSSGDGIEIGGTGTATPSVSVDYDTANNFINKAADGTTIEAGDKIVYEDATDTTVKEIAVSDLIALAPQGTLTELQEGDYVTITDESGPSPEISVDGTISVTANKLVARDINSFAYAATAAGGDSSTKLATTAFVQNAVTGSLTLAGGFNADTGDIDGTTDNLTFGASRVAISVGQYYVVTAGGDFFGDVTENLSPGDSVIVETAAAQGASVIGDFIIVKSEQDVATDSVIGLGNVSGTASQIGVAYSNGTATLTNLDRGSSQNIFKTIASPSGNDITASSNSSTINFAQAGGTTITNNSSTNTITISSTDTNTTYTASDGVKLDGTVFKADLNNYTQLTTAGVNTTVANRTYAVQLDSSGHLAVNVPWTDGFTLPVATDGALGGIQIGYTENGKNYPVELSSEKAYVNVPWTDTTPSVMTVSTLGTAKLTSSEAVTQAAIDPPSSEVGRTYPSQLDSNQSLVMNVPWIEYSAGSGIIIANNSTNPNISKNIAVDIESTVNAAAVSAPTSTPNQSYLVQTSSDPAYSGKLVVNVPWSAKGGGNVNSVSATSAANSTGTAIEVSPNTGDVKIQPFAFAGGSNVGYVPSSGNTDQTVKYLRADGTWVDPSIPVYFSIKGQSEVIANTGNITSNTQGGGNINDWSVEDLSTPGQFAFRVNFDGRTDTGTDYMVNFTCENKIEQSSNVFTPAVAYIVNKTDQSFEVYLFSAFQTVIGKPLTGDTPINFQIYK